jgi:manganese-dependent inorganic pyrophosphatase
MARTYVIGHVNPDTDSIAAAVGYAWLLRERDSDDFVAARAGPTNPQTTWVLKRLELEPPALLTDASPRFESVTRRLDTAAPDSPLREAWAILNRTGGVAPIVDPHDGAPYGMINGVSLFNYFGQLVGPHPHLQEMRRRIPGPARRLRHGVPPSRCHRIEMYQPYPAEEHSN